LYLNVALGSAKPTDEKTQGPPDDLDDGLTQEKLNQLHDIFEEMDEDGGGGLDIDEFKNAMRQTMGNISDKEIELIFMKVGSTFYQKHCILNVFGMVSANNRMLCSRYGITN